MPSGDIVETAADAAGLTKPPLLVLDRVRAFLDEHGLGSGGLRARRIGEGGGSNFTFLLERDDGLFVLRRPPRPPLPPSAHDVVREARLQLALREAGFERLPTIVAVGEDEAVLGVPFYVMTYLEGHVVTDELPAGLDTEAARRALTRHMKRAGRVWIRIYPDVPVSKKPLEVRMGSGKGAPELWVVRVKPGRVIFEVDGVSEALAREALGLAAAKLPIKTRFIERIAE